MNRLESSPSGADADDEPAHPFSKSMLAGKVALVTGGGSGLGRATALQLACCGARVTICGRRGDPLQATVAAAPPGSIDAHVCDIREEDEVEGLVDFVLERHGKIDVLVNNAGGQFFAPAEAITPKGFRTVMRLNVEGTWLVTHAVATKAMIPSQKGGKVISVTLSPHNGMPGMAHSGAARAAVENLMRTLSVEWARYGITLLSVAAGQFATQTLLTKYPEQLVAHLRHTIPAGRLGTEREFACLIAYLACDVASFFSGTTITIDGARDNWLGSWPPKLITDEDGELVSEERRR